MKAGRVKEIVLEHKPGKEVTVIDFEFRKSGQDKPAPLPSLPTHFYEHSVASAPGPKATSTVGTKPGSLKSSAAQAAEVQNKLANAVIYCPYQPEHTGKFSKFQFLGYISPSFKTVSGDGTGSPAEIKYRDCSLWEASAFIWAPGGS
jgi:hypothetical protein